MLRQHERDRPVAFRTRRNVVDPAPGAVEDGPRHSHREGTPMRIGHWQLEVKTGDFDANLAKLVTGLERADKDRVEIVCFPECFLTGYPDKEDEARKSAFAVDSPEMMKLLDKTGKFEATFLVGF